MKKDESFLSENKKALLDQAETHLKDVLNAINDIRDGHSEASVCKKYNFNKSSFRRLIFNEKIGFKYNGIIKIPASSDKDFRLEDELLSWHERLYLDVFPDRNYTNIPPNIEEVIDYLLSEDNQFLTEREIKVLLGLYRDGGNLQTVGKRYGVTRERIRQISEKGIRKLRNPKALRIFEYGIVSIEAMDRIRHQRMASAIAEAELNDYSRIEYDIKNADPQRLHELRNLIDERYNSLSNGYRNVDIYDLELSIRATNVLKRNGINTLCDLSKLNKGQLFKMRNMGRKTMDEILEKLRDYGIELEDEE